MIFERHVQHIQIGNMGIHYWPSLYGLALYGLDRMIVKNEINVNIGGMAIIFTSKQKLHGNPHKQAGLGCREISIDKNPF